MDRAKPFDWIARVAQRQPSLFAHWGLCRGAAGQWEPDEARVSRPVVCPVKAGMFSREQTCRGRSQSPVVWIAEERETEPSKPIDKTSRGEVTSHRAVTTVNALWPRK